MRVGEVLMSEIPVIPEMDPAGAVRTYRENYVNFQTLVGRETALEGVDLKTPAEQPIEELDLPAALREAMAAYQESHPKAPQLVPVKYMRVVNGKPELVIEDERPLPEEQDLVTFSHTVTTTSIDTMAVVVHQLVATLNPDAEAATK
jgi:hypothetical protein